MGLGTKNRQRHTAEVCKQHLREKYRDRIALVEEFIAEFEGAKGESEHELPVLLRAFVVADKNVRWSRFTDVRGIDKEMLARLDAHFETWLNPPANRSEST